MMRAAYELEAERRPLLMRRRRESPPRHHTKLWFVFGMLLMLVAGSAAVWTATAPSAVTSVPSTITEAESRVKPVEKSGKHRRASSTVRSRSLFTCVLCVVAALVILLPRLACGPDDVNGEAAGPGDAEAVVSKELRQGLALLVPWLAVAVPLDSIDRSVVRGEFPYPLTLVALQLSGSALLGAACTKTKPPPLKDDEETSPQHILYLLGMCLALATSLLAEAERSCGPRLVAAFGSGQALVVLFLACALDPPSSSRGRRLDEEEEDEEEEGEECVFGGAPGVPGLAALLALFITFGGAAVMGLGEAEIGPVGAGCVLTVVGGQCCSAAFLVGTDHFLRKHAKEPIMSVLATISTSGACLATFAALIFEVILPRFFSAFDRLAPPSPAYWLLATDVCGTALLLALSLAVLRRFSAIVFVLFVAAGSAISLFVQASLFGDVLTSLEYKGAMILVLGLAIWGLEVSKATLEKPPPLSALPPGSDPLPPSNFLGRSMPRHHHDAHQEEEDDDDEEDSYRHLPLDELAIVRLGRSGLSMPSSSTSLQNYQQPSQ